MIMISTEQESALKLCESELRQYADLLVQSCPDLPPQQIAGVMLFCNRVADKIKKAIKPIPQDA